MCPSRAPMEVTCEICAPTLEDMWQLSRVRRLPVEIFANPTGVTNVYADDITFCLRVIRYVTGTQIPAKCTLPKRSLR